MPELENFSVTQGNPLDVNFDVDTDAEGADLDGASITWRAFAQNYGIPSGAAVITKTLGNGIDVLVSYEQKFVVHLDEADTETLEPKNYFHQADVIDGLGREFTVTQGIMTVLVSY